MSQSSPVVRCKCCRLRYPEPIRYTVVNGDGLCVTCKVHQSSEINQTVKRHSEHEAMLYPRLEAATKAAAEADAERKQFGQKMHWALRSRDHTIEVLRKISDLHELYLDGSCKCGQRKGCKVGALLDDRSVQTLIRRVDEYEAQQRRRQQIAREIDRDPYASWDDYVREEASERRPDADTA